MRRTTTRPEEREDRRSAGPPAATATDPKPGRWLALSTRVSKALRSAGSFLGPEKSRNRQTDCPSRRERERGQREKRRRERKLKARRRCCRWRGHAHGSEAWAQTIGVSGTEESGDHSSPPSSRAPGLARLARNPLVAGALVATASAELSCLGVGGDGRAAAAAGFGHASPEHGHRLRERGGVAVSFSLPARPKIPPFRFF
jgi:hypothetical protein